MDINKNDLKKIAKEIAQSSPDIVFYVLYNEKTGDITWEEFVDTSSRVDMDEDWLFIGRYRGRRGQSCTQTAIRQEIADAIVSSVRKEEADDEYYETINRRYMNEKTKIRYAIIEENLRTTDRDVEIMPEGTTKEEAIAKAERLWHSLHPQDRQERRVEVYYGAVNEECTDLLAWDNEGYDEAEKAHVDTADGYTSVAEFKEEKDTSVFLTADSTNGILQWRSDRNFGENPPTIVDNFAWELEHMGDEDFIGGWMDTDSEEYQDIKDRYGIEVKEERS